MKSKKLNNYLMGIDGPNDAELPFGSTKVLVAWIEELVEKAKFTAMSVEIQEKECEEEQGGISTLDSPGGTEQWAVKMREHNGKKKISACVTAQQNRLKGSFQTDVGLLKKHVTIEEASTLSEQSVISRRKPSYLLCLIN